MSPLDAAFHAAHDYPGGASALAARLGKRPATFCHELTGEGTAKLGLLDAVKLAHLTGTTTIAQAFCSEVGGVFVSLPMLMEGSDMQSLAAAVKEFGELVTEVAASMADGRVTGNELARIEREALEAHAAINALVLHAQRVHENGHPVRPVGGLD